MPPSARQASTSAASSTVPPDQPAGHGRDVAAGRSDRGARGAAAVDGGEREGGELGRGLGAIGGIVAEGPREELVEARERHGGMRRGEVPSRGRAAVRPRAAGEAWVRRGSRSGGAAVGDTERRDACGADPVSISTSVHPNENTSARTPTGSPRSTSGAR